LAPTLSVGIEIGWQALVEGVMDCIVNTEMVARAAIAACCGDAA
jgi:hypothetical protein